MAKNKGKNRLWIVLAIFGGLIICGGLGVVIAKMPLAARLFIKTSTPTEITIPPAESSPTEVSSKLIDQPVSNTPTAADITTCGQKGSLVILVTAVDLQTWDIPHTADFIRYVKIDFSNKSVTAVALPRDLWVQTPELAAGGTTADRLGEVYFYSVENDTGDQRSIMIHATELEAQTLYDNFAVVPDYYLTLDGGVVGQVVDNLGGIDIDNAADVTIENVLFPAGRLHLVGDQATIYSRWMNNGTEWERISRQKVIMLGIWNKLVDPANVANMPKLVQQFSDSYVTDMSPELVTSLICMVKQVTKDKVNFISIGPDMVSSGTNDTMLPDTQKITQFLGEQLTK